MVNIVDIVDFELEHCHRWYRISILNSIFQPRPEASGSVVRRARPRAEQRSMGEFVFPETLKRMRNWDQDQGKERRDDRGASQPSTGLFVNKSKINHHNFEGKTVTSDQKSHPSQVWNQKFSLEMSFSQVGEIFRLGHQTKA